LLDGNRGQKFAQISSLSTDFSPGGKEGREQRFQKPERCFAFVGAAVPVHF
jgi:hypothetical protein